MTLYPQQAQQDYPGDSYDAVVNGTPDPETLIGDDFRFGDTQHEVGEIRGDAISWDPEVFGGMGDTLDHVHQALAA